MPYLSKGNPYNTKYAIPKYVLTEKEHRAISTPKSPYLTISYPQPPVNVAAKAPRGTVSVAPPQDFRPTTGKIYSSGTLGSLGDFDGGGSLGPMAGRRRRRCGCGGRCPACKRGARSGLGADLLPCPPNAPPGSTGCIAVSVPTGFGPGVATATGTRYNSLNLDAQGYYAQMKAAGQSSITVPNYALTAAEKTAFAAAPFGINASMGGMAYAATQNGSRPFTVIDGYWVTYNAPKRTLKILWPAAGVIEGVSSLVSDILAEIRKLGCAITDSALVAAAVKASPSGAAASAIAARLCASQNQGTPFVPPPPPPSSGIGGVAILGAAAAAAYFILHR